MGWIDAARRRLRGDRDADPAVAGEETRSVEVGDGMAVVFVRRSGGAADEDDGATPGEVTERYVGIRGTPSRVVRDVARERLTRRHGVIRRIEKRWPAVLSRSP